MSRKRDWISFLSSIGSSKSKETSIGSSISKEKHPSLRTKSNSLWSMTDAPHYTSRTYRMGLVSSNHVMVNRIRISYGKKVVTRSRQLDELAQKHAQIMASQQSLFHSEPSAETLRHKLQTSGHVGENVHRGPNVQYIQDLIEFDTGCKLSKRNLLSDDFTEFGMGTARSADGQLYMCQLFRVKNERD